MNSGNLDPQAKFEDLEKELIQMNSNQEMLKRNYNELIELKHVLEKDNVFFASTADPEHMAYDEEAEVGSSGETQGLGAFGIKLGFVTGVVERGKMMSFERVLWRATRGNLFMKTAPVEERIEDPKSVLLCLVLSRSASLGLLRRLPCWCSSGRHDGEAGVHHLLPGRAR